MLCKVINTNKRQLEEETNQWLASGKYEIVKVIQTEDSNMGYITLTIFYMTRQRKHRSLQLL